MKSTLAITSVVSILFSFIAAKSIESPASIKNKRICRSCGELAKQVEKRMEETKANPRVVQVASRIGADGRPIPGRKIDYLTSESRFLDVFTDICEPLEYAQKSACYLISNEYEDQLKEWFTGSQHGKESFLEEFCFKELPDCNKKVHEASLTDIEIENYEEDKDKIDDDFMPEAKEENIKSENNNFAYEAVERIKDLRDNFYDFLELFDENVRQFLIKNEKLNLNLMKLIKEEQLNFFINNWYFVVLSILISIIIPLFYVSSLQNKNKIKDVKSKTSNQIKKKSSSKSNIKVEETSESDAAEADDETTGNARKSGRSSRILSSEPASKSKISSKRNSRSKID